MKTEDVVRDEAKYILNFFDDEIALSGTGQITTFNNLGFKGIIDKPDGWYLPYNKNDIAIILETKSEKTDIDTQKCILEIRKNCDIVLQKYDHVIGILHNGKETRCFFNNKPFDVPDELQDKSYYIKSIKDKPIDKQLIYKLTSRINNCLHFNFGIKNLYHRMIFTACALVAERYNKFALMPGMDYTTFHSSIHSTLSKSLQDSRLQNQKLDILLEVYSEIKMNSTENQDAIDDFINWVKDISKTINSNFWRGEDVMSIFFNEFNRYKSKSEQGQIFTPDHITSLMYRIIDCNMNDYILDAACGSGAFLVKAMSNMIEESGGVETNKAKEIKSNRLLGIEFDREIFALACANMLIHKDGKTNLTQLDSRTQKACSWIEEKKVTKVLMNPPYENKYGCVDIVINVLNSVDKGTMCAFILPDKKLEKVSEKKVRNLLKNHRIEKIIKLPEDLFFGVGITTSIFIIQAGIPQNNKEIYGCYIEKDGLETVKNQGRQDVRNKWNEIEKYWVESIYKSYDEKYGTSQWIDPSEHLSYQMPKVPFSINNSDFEKVAMEYQLFKEDISVKDFESRIINTVLYKSNIIEEIDSINIKLNNMNSNIVTPEDIDTNFLYQEKKWSSFIIEDLFDIVRPQSRTTKKYELGTVPFVSSGNFNNGVDSYREPLLREELDKGNCITVSPVDGSSFYQPIDFLGRGGGGSSIILLYNDLLNEDNGLFVAGVIRKVMQTLYYYGDMGSSTTIKKEQIQLPVNDIGEPDWEYMSKYMKNIRRLVIGKIDILHNAIK